MWIDNRKFLKHKLLLSLDTLKKQRDSLSNDTIDGEPNLYIGLYCPEYKEVFKIHMEKYIVLWLDKHWNCIDELITNLEFAQTLKREVLIYFSNHYLALIKKCGYLYVNNRTLQLKLKCLDEMINFEEKWHKNYQYLVKDVKKHEAEYQKIIADYEKGVL